MPRGKKFTLVAARLLPDRQSPPGRCDVESRRLSDNKPGTFQLQVEWVKVLRADK